MMSSHILIEKIPNFRHFLAMFFEQSIAIIVNTKILIYPFTLGIDVVLIPINNWMLNSYSIIK